MTVNIFSYPSGTGGNFWLFVAKRGEAGFSPVIYLCNMVTGKELAAGKAGREKPLPLEDNPLHAAGCRVVLPVRMVLKLYDVIAARVPFGYEDESGFHYGVHIAS